MKRNNCSGQGTYTARYVDDIVKEFMRNCFAKINATPKDVALEANYKSLLAKVRREIRQQEMEIDSLTEDEKTTRREIPKALMGKSVMKPEDLSKTLEEIQENITNALDALKELKTREFNIKKEFSELDSKYAEFVGWAKQFETASLEVQRMIVNKMVKEISIGKGIDGEYDVKILLRGTYNHFINPEYAVA